jgi:major membrane immunogen (membrane-anchored lipoprotein)
MRKRTKVLVNLFLLGLTFTTGCANNKKADDNTKEMAASVNNETVTNEIKYRDGEYEVTTDKDYEGFYCKAKITIKNNKITNVEWNIYDSDDKIFDEKYEEVYAGQPIYQQQCRDDLKGAKTYGPKLVEVQDIMKVDAISGATWANENFKLVINLALKKAKR